MNTASDSAELPARSESETNTPNPVDRFAASEAAVEPIFSDQPTSAAPKAPVGPGLWEALLWIVAFYFIEFAGGIVWAMGVGVFHVVTTGQAPAATQIGPLLEPVMAWMIGSIKLIEVVVALLAIRLRFGPRAFALTGFRSVPALHAVVLGLAVVPTAFLSGQSYALLHGYWERLAEDVPLLEAMDELSSIETVQEMAETTPLAALVLIIAVFPALNEEFLFRAAIGRGLLGRYGLIAGIALTSMLFAAMHLSPVHAVALLPLAVLMHVAYLSSGSIWSCVGVHFLNNAMSVALMKWATVAPEVGGMAADVTEASFSPILFTAAAACVAATIWLLFKIRVGWTLPDGQRWKAPQTSAEAPPQELGATVAVPAPPTAPVVVTAICYAIFPVAFAVSIWLQQV